MTKPIVSAILGLLLCGSLFSGDVTGKWSGSVILKMPDGNTEHQAAWVSLKQAGSTLTGTAGPSSDRQSEIKEGKVDGDRIEFKVAVEDAVVLIKLHPEGEILKGEALIDTNDGRLTANLELKRLP